MPILDASTTDKRPQNRRPLQILKSFKSGDFNEFENETENHVQIQILEINDKRTAHSLSNVSM